MTQGIRPTLFPYRRRFATEVSSSRRAWSERSGVFVRLQAGTEGIIGWGEASPLPGYSPESLDQTIDVLERVVLGHDGIQAVLEGSDPAQIHAGIVAGLRHLPREIGSVRFGLETALLDLAGRFHGLPAPALWSQGETVDWAEIETADLCSDAEQFDGKAFDGKAGEEKRLEGEAPNHSSVLKVKVGRAGAFAREFDALRRIRERFPFLRLRLDANGAWSTELVSDYLDQLSGLGIQWIEEPTTVGSKEELQRLCAGSPVPLALDESIHRLGLESEDLKALRPAAIILKPHVLGGFRCVELGRSTISMGIAAVVSHLFDGPLAYRASYALALALDSFGVAEKQTHGLARHAGLSAWPEMAEQLASPPDTWGPGLGLKWDLQCMQ